MRVEGNRPDAPPGRSRRPRRSTLRLLVATSIPLAACEGDQSILAPRGYAADRIADLWWFMFAVGTAVWLVVVIVAIAALFAKRTVTDEAPPVERVGGDDRRTGWVIRGVVVTVVILVGVFGFSLATGRAIQSIERREALTIEVTGRQWWWDIRYDDPIEGRRFRTANELHVPVGVPVRVLLRSTDVIHSFWVPNLAGKVDLVPGRTNTIWLQVDEPGVYRGQCAEFCGMQHANMALVTVGMDPDEFAAWVGAQSLPARQPDDPLAARGEELFWSTGCVLCHTIRGTPAMADAGPDLTHVGSRRTLAAGILPNSRGNLGGWIADPQGIKPGNHMPRVPLSPEELRALIAYLEALR